MKQELIDTTIDLYTISRKIKRHHVDFQEKYPKIHQQLENDEITKSLSIGQLLLKELYFFKKWTK